MEIIIGYLSIFFVGLYSYQLIYLVLPLIKKGKVMPSASRYYRYAVLVAARNEESVIGQLIESLNRQNYPKELLDVYVVADNCTDNTASISRMNGAIVFERFNSQEKGKGFAIDYLLNNIFDEVGNDYYDAYIVFDADNLVDSEYVKEINKVFDQGYSVITSYRNSKNYGDNWISAGYSLGFIRESAFLNNSRMMLNTSCFVSGTGFMFSKQVINKSGGWKYYLLTEDIQFTTEQILEGNTIGYAHNAVFYDEQPTKISTSYHQRLRWAKGFIQVFNKYSGKLFSSIFGGYNYFSSYDIFLTLLPAIIGGVILPGLGILAVLKDVTTIKQLMAIINSYSVDLIKGYLAMVMMAAVITINQWKQIRTSSAKKILYCFTYPLFMVTYLPISIIALFKDVTWKPIKHGETKSVVDYEGYQRID